MTSAARTIGLRHVILQLNWRLTGINSNTRFRRID